MTSVVGSSITAGATITRHAPSRLTCISAHCRIGWQDWPRGCTTKTGLFDSVPEQVIVNEYVPGQGIAMHTDHRGFGPTVCTISLLDDWEMDFAEHWKDKTPALLQRGSCVLLTESARSVWQHGIAPRKTDTLLGGQRNRKRRLSLTFRTVLNRDGLNRMIHGCCSSKWQLSPTAHNPCPSASRSSHPMRCTCGS